MGLRLGFHYHIPAEKRDDGIWMASPQGCFVDSLAVNAEKIICFLHTPHPSRRNQLDYRLKNANIDLVDIGQHCSVMKRSIFASHFVAPLDAWRGRLDLLLNRGPSPLLPSFCAAARRNNIKTALLLVGSYVDGVEDLPQPRWRKELIRIWSLINQHQQDVAARQSLTFVNSRKLYDSLNGFIPLLVETRTTTLSEGDFFVREDTCQGSIIRLLYTGRFDRAKGLLEMVEALAILRRNGHNVVLDLVGWDDSGTGVEAEIFHFSKKLGVADLVFNHGRKAVGEELFNYYRQADIYLIASKANEGFPRTIWEAMAHSLPVLSTKVGSIPQFLGDAAELIEPRSVSAIVKGVEKILASSALRQVMILRGMSLARENTLERRSKDLMAYMEKYLQIGSHQ